MSDDDAYDSKRNKSDLDESFDPSSPEAKRKKKKKSSSSSKLRSPVSPSPSASSTISTSYFLSKVNPAFSNRLNSTSPRALISRVGILALLTVVMIFVFVQFQLSLDDLEAEELAASLEKAKMGKMDDEVIVQKMGKGPPKLNLVNEREFGCKEITCISECNGKASAKCTKSHKCMAERLHICHKRCRKIRCEERCKNEPKMGYVEKEQGLENCKEGCTGPTASHNKCIVKCHVKWKPCKNKCYENANKFKCDNPKILALLTTPSADGKPPPNSKSDDEDDEDGGGGGGGDDDEDDAPPPPPLKKGKPAKAALPGLDDDDLL